MSKPVNSRSKPPRIRRDAAAARAAILDAAERRMIAHGPAGIRLQEVAADVGVSHSTVLHHFGSREALVQAVIARCLDEIHGSLVETIGASTGEEDQVAAMLDGVFEALTAKGHGRTLMWLALEGIRMENPGLAAVVDATHALRKTKHRGRAQPSREDTAHTVVLATLALLGSAVVGPQLLANAGLRDDAAAGARFRAWLAHVLARHLESGGSPTRR